jgi:copper oxidase (laccase) domain-containing protein
LEQLRSLYPEAVSVSERFSPVAGFDLWRAAQSQLQNAGVPGQNVTLIRECTASHPKRYFSHRRDQGETGRMLAMVQIEDPFPQPAHLPGKRPILCKKRGNHGNQ